MQNQSSSIKRPSDGSEKPQKGCVRQIVETWR